jgi:hypothetical protein
MAFRNLKDFTLKYFEFILVISLLGGLSFILLVVPQKLGFLNYQKGQRHSIRPRGSGGI